MKSFAQGYIAARGQQLSLLARVLGLFPEPERQVLQLGKEKPWDFQLEMSLFMDQLPSPAPPLLFSPVGLDLGVQVTLEPLEQKGTSSGLPNFRIGAPPSEGQMPSPRMLV